MARYQSRGIALTCVVLALLSYAAFAVRINEDAKNGIESTIPRVSTHAEFPSQPGDGIEGLALVFDGEDGSKVKQLWHEATNISTFQDVSLTRHAFEVMAGSWLGNGEEEVRTVRGHMPVFSEKDQAETFFTGVSAKHGDISLTGEFDPNGGFNNSVLLQGRSSITGRHLWSRQLSALPSSGNTIAISPSAKYAAAALAFDHSFVVPGYGSLQCLNPKTGKTTQHLDFPRGVFPLSVSSMTDEGIVAVAMGSEVVVFDCSSGKELFRTAVKMVSTSVALSADASMLAFGVLEVEVFQRAGNTYNKVSELSPSPKGNQPGWFAQKMEFSPSEKTLVLAVNNGTTVAHPAVVAYNFTAAGKAQLKWLHEYQNTFEYSTLQNSFSGLAFSSDGSVVAVSTWGSKNDTDPTIRVLCAHCGMLAGSAATRGSMFAVDVESTMNGRRIVVAAGGKADHANLMAAGGDLYVFEILRKKMEDGLYGSCVHAKPTVVTDLNTDDAIMKPFSSGFNKGISDLSLEEMQARCGAKLDAQPWLARREGNARQLDSVQIPDSFDSRTQWPNCVHPIRNQASCGSCYAFGASEAFSDRLCIATKGKTNQVLSPQDIVSCDSLDNGCGGGFLLYAWDFMAFNGLTTDKCMPYTAGSGTVDACSAACADGSQAKLYYIDNSTITYFGSEQDMQRAIMTDGPIEAAFNVYSDFMNYKSGVYVPDVSTGMIGGHAIKIIGWGVDKQSSLPYWIVANSWGSDWGMNGYFHIVRGRNAAGIEYNNIWGLPKL